ncbi:hypothetical protein RGUI_0814 [Rhodovulum sp. P5]|uniref:hypothetical protein n=1 Tax=Rhodovulum phage vB_RhkS_P1 TaxID=1873452 RepID=UPI00080A9B54|nr:hypothetical protein [Rhodovulum sp. P5]YP_009285899.1 hypothetical protein BI026_gp14 [Rhodovulum phage vB_RhkS_P1]ANT39885.1 hypothetical protein Rhks_14 [Rhodovulum phage vB_RhkS_P1]ARE38955.1 hypothetical protein RGUI_0814 [Rhodovulum sp. P5]
MPAPHPKRAEVLALARAGMRPVEIARQLEIASPTVNSMITCARAMGQDVPHFQRARPGTGVRGHLRVPLTDVARADLAEAAASRGVSLPVLASRVLEAAAEDGLVAAVLDDADETGGRADG